MMPLRLTLAALAAATVGTGATSLPLPAGPALPGQTAVVVQGPSACASPAVPGAPARPAATTSTTLPAAARRLAAGGASVTVTCGPEEATAAVLRAARSGRRLVLGDGPDVRAALSLAAVDHPGQRFVALPRR